MTKVARGAPASRQRGLGNAADARTPLLSRPAPARARPPPPPLRGPRHRVSKRQRLSDAEAAVATVERVRAELEAELRRQTLVVEKLRADVSRSKQQTVLAEDDRYKGLDEVRGSRRAREAVARC